MRAVIVSDAHLLGPTDPAQHCFVGWLKGLECDELVLLGDIFHHWWTFDGAVMPAHGPVLEVLSVLRAQGMHIVFVPGNHDFAAGPLLRREVGAEVRGPHTRRYGSASWHLAHGDEADDSLGYRVTRQVLRGRLFAAVMAVLGPSWGLRLLQKLAGASRDYPAAAQPLLERQRVWAGGPLGDGAQVVVMGHLHAPSVVSVDGGTVVHLGDWATRRSFLVVDDGHGRLRSADEHGRWTEAVLGEVVPRA